MMTIASRVLTLRGATTDTEIAVRVFTPEQQESTWSCRYEIDWPHGQWGHAAVGFDAMQALILALQMTGAAIYTSDYHKSGSLSWGDPGRGYGFPVPHGVRDMLVGDDARFF
jgi:hypothetical protein